jgi:hypothetical protein
MRREEGYGGCRVHGSVTILRADGFHCEECRKLATYHDVIVAACPHCHESLLVPRPSLMVPGLKAEGNFPSVRLMWCHEDPDLYNGVHLAYVSAVRDRFEKLFVPPVVVTPGRPGPVLRLSCPHCLKALPTASEAPTCRLCGANVVTVDVKYPRGRDVTGKRWICTRFGCSGDHSGEENDFGLDGHVIAAMANGGFAGTM